MDTPYAAPESPLNATGTTPAEGGFDPDEDVRVIQRGLRFARFVAVPLFLCGLMYGATVVQIALFTRQMASVICVEIGFALHAVALIYIGSRVYEASPVFTIAGAVVSAGAAFFAFVWFVYLLLQGAIAPLPFMDAAMASLCAIGSVVFIGTASRVSAARARI